MFNKIIKLVIGDMNDKRAYKQMMKSVNLLPKDYRFAFKKIQKYIYTVGAPGGDMTIFTDMSIFTDLIDLFECSAADGRPVVDVIGTDVGKFSDEYMSAYSTNTETLKEKLNKEIIEKLKSKE